VFLEVYPQVLGVSTHKTCSKCGELKSLELFRRTKKAADGRHSECKDCSREYQRITKEHIREHRQEYYQSNIEHIRAGQREYRKTHKQQAREYMREYMRAYFRSSTGKTVCRTSDSRRRARKLNLPDTFTAIDWQLALEHFGGCCAVCGRPAGLWHTLAVDHWIPLSKGGPTTPDNLVPLCHGTDGCNNSKHDRAPSEWLIERFGPRKGRAIQRRVEAYLNSRKPRDKDAS
jgi:hypothetical protein